MSADITESPKAASAGPSKLVTILAGGAFALSLANTVLLVLNPTASKVEQFNESLKSDLADSIASVHKKIDGLKSAEVEWQNVLKKSSEKPDAVYKIVKSPDGFLTLTEITPAAGEASEPPVK
ncbi:hypothetical protein [Quatrionicoccus australiensis]|uniref:hypothetical protein n=1 Tax=Quatrionicoccus australiensis TaxID=138118 RepID=UPI001CF8E188|nr:hypothetical protein [Quatrionicoccus australiensis]UCV15509.1 hypothetical protein KI612_02025 [Quatrionicoccus australiensis]